LHTPWIGLKTFFCLHNVELYEQMKPQSQPTIERKAFSLKETAQTLGVSLQTVRRLVKEKKLKTVRLTDRGQHLVAVMEIDRLLKKGAE